MLILYLFLRRMRVTLLITLAIPTSLLACLVVMYFAGGTINVLTMMGLIICTGMLVDKFVHRDITSEVFTVSHQLNPDGITKRLAAVVTIEIPLKGQPIGWC